MVVTRRRSLSVSSEQGSSTVEESVPAENVAVKGKMAELKEEPVPSSPLRRSRRLSINLDDLPVEVLTPKRPRRQSFTEEETPAEVLTPKRTRRQSLTADEVVTLVLTPKRTRRQSLTLEKSSAEVLTPRKTRQQSLTIEEPPFRRTRKSIGPLPTVSENELEVIDLEGSDILPPTKVRTPVPRRNTRKSIVISPMLIVEEVVEETESDQSIEQQIIDIKKSISDRSASALGDIREEEEAESHEPTVMQVARDDDCNKIAIVLHPSIDQPKGDLTSVTSKPMILSGRTELMTGNQENQGPEKITTNNAAKISEVQSGKVLAAPSDRVIPRGIPKSGRWWKSEKTRFSSMIQVKPLKTSWAKKMQIKEDRKMVLAVAAAALEARKQRIESLKERQKLNKERREANARKAEVVQVIKDSRKIKKMKKKQLKYIETRDTDAIKEKLMK